MTVLAAKKTRSSLTDLRIKRKSGIAGIAIQSNWPIRMEK